VTHEKSIAKFFADRIIEIWDGMIKKDYVNQSHDVYQRADDSNIYLKDLDEEEICGKGMKVSVFRDRGLEVNPQIRLNLIWKDDKLYIQSPQDVALVLAGEESGCFVLDEHKPALEQKQVVETSYELPAVEAKKRASLPMSEIWKMAHENIRL